MSSHLSLSTMAGRAGRELSIALSRLPGNVVRKVLGWREQVRRS